jgi:hypothetical protein
MVGPPDGLVERRLLQLPRLPSFGESGESGDSLLNSFSNELLDFVGGIRLKLWKLSKLSPELPNGRRLENSSGYLISQFDSQDINWQTVNFSLESHLSYERSLDFFGDQSVVLVPMAGHTVGSVGMFVNLGTKGVLFFTGDTTWSVEGFQRPAHKFSLMRSVVDANVSELEQEILRVYELLKQHQDLTIIPAHDHDAYPANAIYPEFMESN